MYRVEQFFGVTYQENEDVHSIADLPHPLQEWLASEDTNFSEFSILDHHSLLLAFQEAFYPDSISRAPSALCITWSSVSSVGTDLMSRACSDSIALQTLWKFVTWRFQSSALDIPETCCFT